MEQKQKILIVDDTEINRMILADILEQDYEIMEASSGVEAVSILKQKSAEIALVLLDIVMPEMDGFEVLAVMARNNWLQNVPVIMISAEVSSSYVDHAYDLGATDYITRPFDEKTVQRRVHNTIMLYTKQKVLEDMVAEQIMEKERSNSQMVEILSNIVEFRNGESGLHVLHIRVITDMLLQDLCRRAPQYELTGAKIALITNASALHDIGKISIDEKVLNKPGKLTQEEYEHMKQHTVIGAKMLEEASSYVKTDLIREAHDICRWHHERYDGRGYPDGLKGEEIPISAQVVAMADVYDALTSERVYKPAYTHEKAVEMITNGECGAFNPLLLECLLACSAELSRQLEVKSPKSVNNIETRQVLAELMSRDELSLSGQMLSQLEQERQKFSFLISQIGDIVFEYDVEDRVLSLSRGGMELLGLPREIVDPMNNELIAMLGEDALRQIGEQVKQLGFGSPTFTGEYALQVKGEPRRASVTLCALWDGVENANFSKLVGRAELL